MSLVSLEIELFFNLVISALDEFIFKKWNIKSIYKNILMFIYLHPKKNENLMNALI